MSDRPDILTRVLSRAESVRVRNVLNPLLWLNAVSVPSCLAGAVLLRDELLLSAPALAVGLLTPLATLAAYAYFAIRDADRLHSEEFLIAQQHLLLLGKGGSTAPVDSIPIASDPEPSLPSQDQPSEI